MALCEIVPETYWRWAASEGCRWASAITVGKQVNRMEQGRGMFATADLEDMQEVLRVPKSLFLTVDTALASPVLGPAIRDAGLGVDDILTLHLLHEKSLGTESRYAAHFVEQPLLYDQTVHWSAEERDELRGTNLHAMTEQLLVQIRDDFDNIQAKVLSAHPSLFPAGFFTLEQYTWGLSTLWSRAFDLVVEGGLRRCVVPIADMFNQPDTAEEEAAGVHGYDDATQCFRVVLQRGVRSGEQICITYGPFGNNKLLRVYGFALPPPNPYDTVDIYAPLDPSLPHHSLKLALLSECGDAGETGWPVMRSGVSMELMRLLRVQRMEETELMDPAVVARVKQGKAVSILNEIGVCRSLSAALEMMHDRMCSTLENDEASVLRWTEYPHTRPSLRGILAVYFRIGEARVLRGAREYLDARDERATAMFESDTATPEDLQ